MKLQKVTKERIAQIEEVTEGVVEFTSVGEEIKSVKITLEDDILVIEGGFNNLSVSEELKSEKLLLRWQAEVAGSKFLMDKVFDNDDSLRNFIDEHLSNLPEDELSITTIMVNENTKKVTTKESK